MRLPRGIQAVVEQFEKLPGIGPKSAQRLAFYLLHVPDPVIREFADSLVQLKQRTKLCERCHQIDEASPCQICQNEQRETNQICVVETPLDVLAIEQSGTYHGQYHVLHGVISPLDSIGPDQLLLRDLVARVHNEGIAEIIIATDPTMEGEATALFIEKMLREAGFTAEQLRITRIGHGLPVGADIEYADGITLSRALEGRREM